jgi:ankyrin repeat protein
MSFLRNSIALVESGFDGDIPQLQDLLEKGYYLESVDGRKHTALSEAACQGHVAMIQYLLSLGANPNSMNDTGRTPLWRAAFNGHLEAAQILLDAGGDPDSRDSSSMETCYDVAKTEELRDLIVWKQLPISLKLLFLGPVGSQTDRRTQRKEKKGN